MKKVDFKTEEGMVAKRYGEMNYSFKNYQGMASQSFYNGVLWAYEKSNAEIASLQEDNEAYRRFHGDAMLELHAERKYRQGLEDTILKITKAFDDAKNAKVICEDCGSALWRT